MADNWTDRIVGDRMTVDQNFNDRVTNSQFSRQQWGLIMTAVEFELEAPEDEDEARIVADTSSLSSIMPELDRMEERGGMGAPGGGAGGPGGGSGSKSGGGVFGTIRSALGIGGGGGGGGRGVDKERLAAAERLAQEYADELQAHLEKRGRWAEIRAVAAEEE